jgi:hypothetical protein
MQGSDITALFRDMLHLSYHLGYRRWGFDVPSWILHIDTFILDASAKLQKSENQLRHVSLSVRLSAWKNSAPTELILMKPDS